MFYIDEFTTELNQAIELRNVAKVAKLLEKFDETSINYPYKKDTVERRRPIDCAAESGTPEIVKLICLKKPKLNEIKDRSGRYALHYAVSRPLRSQHDLKEACQVIEML